MEATPMTKSNQSFLRDITIVATSITAGAAIGSLWHGFGHLRNIYSSDAKRRKRELQKLEKENVERLKSRLVIGCVLGAAAGIGLGILLASPSSEKEE
ncbi:hypothetical protein BVY04_02875 [bacterium M21]|nr:hypothetical protein BVY04_02875 [bacterium M21]